MDERTWWLPRWPIQEVRTGKRDCRYPKAQHIGSTRKTKKARIWRIVYFMMSQGGNRYVLNSLPGVWKFNFRQMPSLRAACIILFLFDQECTAHRRAGTGLQKSAKRPDFFRTRPRPVVFGRTLYFAQRCTEAAEPTSLFSNMYAIMLRQYELISIYCAAFCARCNLWMEILRRITQHMWTERWIGIRTILTIS